MKAGSGKYLVRYINPITGAVSSNSRYTDEQGIRKIIPTNKMEYKINDEWVKPHLVPHIRETKKKANSSKNGYFCARLAKMKGKGIERKRQGKFLQGENEFTDDRRGRCDKLTAHFDKQVEQYGNKCPMTHIPFTMGVAHKIYDVNDFSSGVYSNISPDRIFNHIDYTRQNTIFTSQLWNFSKGERSILELEFLFLPEVLKRYKAIVVERFPDQKYNFTELENRAEHPQERR
tara:strand:+ start:79 stop:774 length:696 start_codon:yes stop_codon:yes gene_type:complete